MAPDCCTTHEAGWRVLSDNRDKLTFCFALLFAAIPLRVAVRTLPSRGGEGREGGHKQGREGEVSERNGDEMIEVAVAKRKGGRLRVRRAMRIKIPMRTSRGKTGEKEETYDQDLNKHEWTKEEQDKIGVR